MGKKTAPGKPAVKIVARNRQAARAYFIDEKFEAGLELRGTEVKSLRRGNCSLQEAYARPRSGELFVFNMNISPYEEGNIENHVPKRPRKLLLHKKEIRHLVEKVEQRGFTIVPLSVYFKRGRAKVEIALARGKTFSDRRDVLRSKDSKKEMERELRRRR